MEEEVYWFNDPTTLIILGLALLVGMSIAMVAWILSRSAAVVPTQDRTWYENPPFILRIVWWPTQWIAFYLDPLISLKRHESMTQRLRMAGMDYSINPAQFLAGQTVYGLMLAFAGWFIADSFGLDVMMPVAGGFIFGYIFIWIWLDDQIKLRRHRTLQTLPFMLDIITLCVESGLNINSAFQQAVDKGPPGGLRDEFGRVLRDIRMGKSRADALRDMKIRLNSPGVNSFVTTLIQAENSGMSLGKILRSQAEQRRIERFSRAEKLAMEAPIKMLLPLLMFIFPLIFILLGFLIYAKWTMDTAGV